MSSILTVEGAEPQVGPNTNAPFEDIPLDARPPFDNGECSGPPYGYGRYNPHIPHYPPSPPGKTLEVTVICEDTLVGIEGVEVIITGTTHVRYTDADGIATFEYMLETGTYTVTFMWNGEPVTEVIMIDCSKQLWDVTIAVPNPTIIKTFYYLIDSDPLDDPVVGLDVDLMVDTDADLIPDAVIASAVTDALGVVVFDVDVGVEYYVAYYWNDPTTLLYDGPISFTAAGCAVAGGLVEELTNYLNPNGVGGGVTLG